MVLEQLRAFLDHRFEFRLGPGLDTERPQPVSSAAAAVKLSPNFGFRFVEEALGVVIRVEVRRDEIGGDAGRNTGRCERD